MKNDIQQEMFALHPFDVVKASYKDSVYYIAGAYDISEFVSPKINDYNAKEELQSALNRYLKKHPEHNVLNVPKFDVILLDDAYTSIQFVQMYCSDVLHFSDKRCREVVQALNTVGFYQIGTYSDEMAMTLGHLLEEANVQLSQNLGWDKIECDSTEEQYNASMQVLESLIRRDYPADL